MRGLYSAVSRTPLSRTAAPGQTEITSWGCAHNVVPPEEVGSISLAQCEGWFKKKNKKKNWTKELLFISHFEDVPFITCNKSFQGLGKKGWLSRAQWTTVMIFSLKPVVRMITNWPSGVQLDLNKIYVEPLDWKCHNWIACIEFTVCLTYFLPFCPLGARFRGHPNKSTLFTWPVYIFILFKVASLCL